MVNRIVGMLLAGSALLVLSTVIWADTQAQKEPQAKKGKEPQLPLAPKEFDKARSGIEKGKLETVEYDSKTFGAKRKMIVYLPPGYSKDKKYPVFYLLHGGTMDENTWAKGGGTGKTWAGGGLAHIILDNLYADKKLVPMIVVMPNGNVDTKGGKGGKGGGKFDFVTAFESDLLTDIMPTAEGRYPIQKDAEHRALAGLSLGGLQALTVGLKHIDKFAWVGGFSSALFGGTTLITNADETNKKLKLLYVACGDNPKETLYKSSKSFHDTLEKQKVQHVWNVIADGNHDFAVWNNDLYVFSQMIFKDKK